MSSNITTPTTTTATTTEKEHKAIEACVSSDKPNYQTIQVYVDKLVKQLRLKLTRPLYRYFTNLYRECVDEVANNPHMYIGGQVDLKLFQTKLRDIRKWNVDVIKAETAKICADITPADWPVAKTIHLILYNESAILLCMRPSDLKDNFFLPLPTVETFVHHCMCAIAKFLFGSPQLVKRYDDDDETTIIRNAKTIRSAVKDSIDETIYELTPSGSIVEKYADRVLNNVERETNTRRPPGDTETDDKYGFNAEDEIPSEDDEEESELGEDNMEPDDEEEEVKDESEDDIQKSKTMRKLRRPSPRRSHSPPRREKEKKRTGDIEIKLK